MAIYDAQGNQLTEAFDVSGNSLQTAYDADGNVIFSKSNVHLKIMEYNVGGWYIGDGTNVPSAKDADYYALQNSMIQNADTDILCICEYWDVFSQTGRTALSLLQQYFPYIHAENGTNQYYGRCICSKYPITDYVTNIYSTGSDGVRYFDKATIDVDGDMIDVIVTHLHPSNQNFKIAQATQLFNYTQTLTNKWIVCGDFNSTLMNPFSTTNAAIYNQFLNAGDHLANGSTFGIFPTACNSDNWASDSFAIDQIITSPTIIIDSVWTDLTKTTDALEEGKIDHIPLLALVTVY